MAFNSKVKIIKAYIPEKVKLYIENKLFTEFEYFQKKYLLKINFLSDPNLVIPEYRIELLNKSKKIISKVQNVNEINIIEKTSIKLDKKQKDEVKLTTKKIKKTKTTKKKNIILRTLWVRRKKKNLN